MLTAFISSKIFYDILRCRLRRGGLKCKRSAPNGDLPRPLPRRGERTCSVFLRHKWKPPPAPPKEGSTSLERLLRKQNEFVYKLITLRSSAIFLDILGCRLRQGGLNCKEKHSYWKPPPAPPKEGSANLERLLRKQNEFVYKLITLISSIIFLDILGCRLRQGGLNCKEKSSYPLRGIS